MNELNTLLLDVRGSKARVYLNDHEIHGPVSIEYPGEAKVFPRPVSITLTVHVYEERRMNPLFDLEGIDPGKASSGRNFKNSGRPTVVDIPYEDIANILFPYVQEWAEELNGSASLDDLIEALDCTYKWDGANICISLEKMGWEVDTELVHILQRAVSIRTALLRQMTEKWVRENDIKPRYKVGDRITLDDHEFAIVSVDEDRATYSIVKADRPSLVSSVVPFEVVDVADDEEELVAT